MARAAATSLPKAQIDLDFQRHPWMIRSRLEHPSRAGKTALGGEANQRVGRPNPGPLSPTRSNARHGRTRNHRLRRAARRRPRAHRCARQPVDRTAEVASLLQSLDEAAALSGRSATGPLTDEKRTETRPAGSGSPPACTRLALQGPGHRVPQCSRCLGCSSWAAVMELDPAERDELEVAALLHDIGKIGVPDTVLLKPGRSRREKRP